MLRLKRVALFQPLVGSCSVRNVCRTVFAWVTPQAHTSTLVKISFVLESHFSPSSQPFVEESVGYVPSFSEHRFWIERSSSSYYSVEWADEILLHASMGEYFNSTFSKIIYQMPAFCRTLCVRASNFDQCGFPSSSIDRLPFSSWKWTTFDTTWIQTEHSLSTAQSNLVIDICCSRARTSVLLIVYLL